MASHGLWFGAGSAFGRRILGIPAKSALEASLEARSLTGSARSKNDDITLSNRLETRATQIPQMTHHRRVAAREALGGEDIVDLRSDHLGLGSEQLRDAVHPLRMEHVSSRRPRVWRPAGHQPEATC